MDEATSVDRVRHLRRIRSAVRSQTSEAALRLAEERVWIDIARIQNSDIRRGAQEIFRTAVNAHDAGAAGDPGRFGESLCGGIGDVINFLETSK